MKNTNNKKIAIIGAGILGLTVGYYLSEKGFRVTIFEKSKKPGGLLKTIKISEGEIECYWHHIFKNDAFILNLLGDLGLKKKLKWLKSKTSVYQDGCFYSLETPFDFLKLPFIQAATKIRLGLAVLYLKKAKNWRRFTKIRAEDWIKKVAGNEAWEYFWGPLFRGKFGDKASSVSAAWFWARVHQRINSRSKNKEILGYPEGSFGKITSSLSEKIKNNKGQLNLKSEVLKIRKRFDGRFSVKSKNKSEICDIVVSTIPPKELNKIISFSKDEIEKFKNLKYLGIISLILILNKRQTNFYWTNILDKRIPFEVVCEHTNFVSPKNFGGNHIIYVGHYTDTNSLLFKLSDRLIFNKYFKSIQLILPSIESDLIDFYVFRDPFAQPVIRTNYQELPRETSIKNLYISSMAHIYPYDRGLNFAVSEAKKILCMIDKHEKRG